jgi:hypothetical protein
MSRNKTPRVSATTVSADRTTYIPEDHLTTEIGGNRLQQLASPSSPSSEARRQRKHMRRNQLIAMRCRGFITICLALCLVMPAAGQDPATPDDLFRQAASLETGEGGAKNMAQAAQLYEQAARLGHSPSMVRLGYLLELGSEVPRDLPRALALFTEAAKAGDTNGQVLLAMSYANGIGTAKDPAIARWWFLSAAASGNQIAQFNLGMMLFTGEGGKKKEAAARRWLDRASSGPAPVLAARAAEFRDKIDKNLFSPDDSGYAFLAGLAGLVVVGAVLSRNSGAGGQSGIGTSTGTSSGGLNSPLGLPSKPKPPRCNPIPVSRSGMIVNDSALSRPGSYAYIHWDCH